MIDKDDLELIQSSLRYLEDVAQEYELDNPDYASALRAFKTKKAREMNSLSEQMFDVLSDLDNYPRFVRDN